MSNQPAALMKPDVQESCDPEPDRSPPGVVSATLYPVRSKTRTFFLRFEVGIRRSGERHPRHEPAGEPPQREPQPAPEAAAGPVRSISPAASRMAQMANTSSGVATDPQPSGSGGSSGSGTNRSVYVEMCVGQTVSPPDPYPGPVGQ